MVADRSRGSCFVVHHNMSVVYALPLGFWSLAASRGRILKYAPVALPMSLAWRAVAANPGYAGKRFLDRQQHIGRDVLLLILYDAIQQAPRLGSVAWRPGSHDDHGVISLGFTS